MQLAMSEITDTQKNVQEFVIFNISAAIYGMHKGNTRIWFDWCFELLEMAYHQPQTSIVTFYNSHV